MNETQLNALLNILSVASEAKGRLDYIESYYPHDSNLLDVRTLLENTIEQTRKTILDEHGQSVLHSASH